MDLCGSRVEAAVRAITLHQHALALIPSLKPHVG